MKAIEQGWEVFSVAKRIQMVVHNLFLIAMELGVVESLIV
jgi:hypothetical protein